MVTDWYPDEEGSIVDGLICGFCYADGAIAEGNAVKWGTSASGRVAVAASTAVGDGINKLPSFFLEENTAANVFGMALNHRECRLYFKSENPEKLLEETHNYLKKVLEK